MGLWQKCMILAAVLTLGSGLCLSFATAANLHPVPDSFGKVLSSAEHLQFLDRHAEPLNVTYQNAWNVHNRRTLHEIPQFLKTAFIHSEDKRFYEHSGVDWSARLSALFANIKSLRSVRGASTITEQSVRMVGPRPRKLWSRWLEGFEAARLEGQFNKDEIFEFYLNQVPYAANRRGVAQAAQYYFDRDLTTLSHKEMLALAVLVRAPSRMDLWKSTSHVDAAIERLTDLMVSRGALDEAQKTLILAEKFNLKTPRPPINAREFIAYIKTHTMLDNAGWPKVQTSLDGNLQERVQTLLDQRLKTLSHKNVFNGAVLAIDHKSGDILSWNVAGKGNSNTPSKFIDAVTTPRQPGSSLKPFLYSLALQKDWTAATLIEDTALVEPVGNGLHAYQNYSRQFYGDVTLRQALGNSLNIPALKTLNHVGGQDYLDYLADFGFSGLNQHPGFYGDGIALGNGEVTLFELVQAYSVLANGGVFKPLHPFYGGLNSSSGQQIISADLASLIGNILSDNRARAFEFGAYNILNFPVQTAVKTGTSSDYRDSWAIGYNHHYTVGIWMGNLDQRPTDGLTGSLGPALLLRSVFAELNQRSETRPLTLSASLEQIDICTDTGQIRRLNQDCQSYPEYFLPGTAPQQQKDDKKPALISLRQPTSGLHIAYDPRLPKTDQAFEFQLTGLLPSDSVEWHIGDKIINSRGASLIWPLKKGEHQVAAIIRRKGEQIHNIIPTPFLVK